MSTTYTPGVNYKKPQIAINDWFVILILQFEKKKKKKKRELQPV
jgi:hypothetical protein